MPDSVAGRFLRHDSERGLLWVYTCPRCGRQFADTTAEVSEPSICHNCYIGGETAALERKRRRERKRNRKETSNDDRRTSLRRPASG